MFTRCAILIGLVCLLALASAPSSQSEEKAAGSDNSNEPAASTGETTATDEPTQRERETIEIPLSEIWALDMPGTRDVGELEPEALKLNDKTLPMEERFALLRKTLTWQISQSLKLTADKKAGPGFVVSRPRPELLKAVRDVLKGEAKRTDSFPAGSDITAVFFSRQLASFVHIYRVERRTNVVEIHYRFVPHETANVTEHFALIPLGTLPRGLYEVKVVQGPMDQKYLDVGYKQGTPAQAARFVSQSFRFEVQK